MSVDIYELAPPYPAEAERERAVQASGALNAADDPELIAIVEEARRTFRTSMAAISIVYRDWQYLIAAAGLPGGPYSRHTSFCGHVIAGRDRMVCVSDTHHDARFAANPSVVGGLLVRSYAGAKLLGLGRCHSAFCVCSIPSRTRGWRSAPMGRWCRWRTRRWPGSTGQRGREQWRAWRRRSRAAATWPPDRAGGGSQPGRRR